MVNVEQQSRQEVADVTHQVRTELHETANGRLDMLDGIATAMQRQQIQFQSRIESVTSSQETGNAATTRENSDNACLTCMDQRRRDNAGQR